MVENLRILNEVAGREHAIVSLFRDTFSASEGTEEGTLIADLVYKLLHDTSDVDRRVFFAEQEKGLVGTIIFSRFIYPTDARRVFLLSPVAVATVHQRQGIGQALIGAGISGMRETGADVIFTYGDPAYYSKFGFEQVTERFASAPFKLQYPQGWMAMSLSGVEASPFVGPSECVPAFDTPALW